MIANATLPLVGSTNAEAPFRPSEIVDFCGDRYEVVANLGSTGFVRPLDDSGCVIRFCWVFEGEPARRLTPVSLNPKEI